MPGALRNITEWRQGTVLPDDAAAHFGLISHEGPERTIVVVISHDCDIACGSDREPVVEVVVGRQIDKLGADTNAKTARRLHLAFRREGKEVPVELEVTAKTAVPKDQLLAFAPRPDLDLDPETLVTLQHWLAARYHRAAFAEEFERRLKDKPARLDRKLAKAMEEAASHILAVLFDVDGGEELERQGPEDAYELRITVLYDSSQDEPAAYEAAQKAADAVEREFEAALKTEGKWRDIRLLACEPASDRAITVADSRLLKRWRLDYMSLADDPQQAMLEPE
jgi:hypothetical protein